MTKTQSSPAARRAATPSPAASKFGATARYTREDEEILVKHDLISQADLDLLRNEAAAGGRGPIEALVERGIYAHAQIERCLDTHAWWNRSTKDHIEHITSEEAIASYKHEYALRGCFTIPHFFSREQFAALDLAMHRIAIQHVDADPAKHKLYHSIGGPLLYSQKALADVVGHPALVKIAKAFLGDDLVQGRCYLKVDDPYRYAGMFGHTHAETHYDCLTQALYMFLYMDSTTHDCGGFQIIPDSHAWYTRGPNGETLYKGKTLPSESVNTNKASLVHDPEPARRWANYETLEMSGNTLLVLTPFLWHAVRPVMHRRRLFSNGFFNAKALTRDFVLRSDYFGTHPYALRDSDLSLLNGFQKGLLNIHLDREAWLKRHGL